MVVDCGFMEMMNGGLCVCEREREREMNKKWIVFRCDVKNRTFYVGWIVKWVVKIDKVVFWVVKS